ncbi:MAG: hypothetical protein H7Y02_07400 [Candidatus Obscuribacterales bacterium]|nr:hypothetical protein [Steroidobacteraceae bacterium]
MTIFIIVCAIMVVAAIALVARPLWLKPLDVSVASSRVSAIVLAIVIPFAAAGLYIKQTNWSWSQVQTTASQQATVEEMVVKLEQRLQQSPDDLDGWMMLGRSYLALERPARAVDAYQKAFDISRGENTDAMLGLGEALVLTDQSALRGRAGELFETVLARDPANPTALWYGAITALTAGHLPIARQRMASLLALNPPEQVRDILQRQLQDIDQQLGGQPQVTQPATEGPATAQRTLTVKVSIAPALAEGLEAKTPLFVLARDGAGPPLAAVRRAAGDLPLTVTLSASDAMIAGRSIATVPQVQVVARVSKKGTPQAQPGDLYGEVSHRFDSNTQATINIVIDRVVP